MYSAITSFLNNLFNNDDKMKPVVRAFAVTLMVVLIVGMGLVLIWGFKKVFPNNNSNIVSVQLPKVDTIRTSTERSNAISEYPKEKIVTKYIHVADTNKKPSIDNSTNVSGNDNHVVGGTGNSVGVNGDVTVNNNGKLFSEAYKIRKLTEIMHLLNAHPACTLGIYVQTGVASGEAVADFINYWNSHGGTIQGTNILSAGTITRGIQPRYVEGPNAVQVWIGTTDEQ